MREWSTEQGLPLQLAYDYDHKHDYFDSGVGKIHRLANKGVGCLRNTGDDAIPRGRAEGRADDWNVALAVGSRLEVLSGRDWRNLDLATRE